MKNKLLSELTKEERRIFEECLDVQDIKNINVNKALDNLNLIEGEESFLNEHGLVEQRQYTYNQVRKCINSLGNYEVREKLLIEETRKIYKSISYLERKLEDLSIDYGFSNAEMKNIINNKLYSY